MAQKAAQAPIQNLTSPNPEELRLPVTPSLDSEVQLAEELRQKTELLKLSREAVLVVDLSDKIAFWSDGAEQLYGWKRAEALGRSPLELLQTQLPRPVAQIETILRREPHWEGELKQTTRYGARISVSSRWALWRDLSGRTLGRFQLDSDITRRKNVEQELRVLSGRLLTIRDEERRRWARELHDSVGQLLSEAVKRGSVASPRRYGSWLASSNSRRSAARIGSATRRGHRGHHRAGTVRRRACRPRRHQGRHHRPPQRR